MSDAYIPPHYLEGDSYHAVGKDYQRIANELRDNGKEIEWTARGPVSILRDENGNKIGEVNVSFMFMYPSIISSENVSP